MKLKNFKYLFITIVMIGTIAACSDEFLEVEPKGIYLSETFYKNESEAYGGLVAVYDIMRKNSAAFDNMITFMNAGSDDHVAGGGNASDGKGMQDFSTNKINSISMPVSFWSAHYQGVSRANILLQKLPEVPMAQAKKDRFTAETKALRAYYYFNLVRMFKNIPLILTPVSSSEWYALEQAKPEDVYKQIEKDLTEAIVALPLTVALENEAGRFTKGAAQALLGKVYLYQNKKMEAAVQLAAVNGSYALVSGKPVFTSQYGYKLLNNFASLWVIDNKFHSESIIEVSHTNTGLFGDWGAWEVDLGFYEGNTVNKMVGPRTHVSLSSEIPTYHSGWSFNPILPELYNLLKTDPRFDATVLDMKALVDAGKSTYIPGYQDTGYFLKKFSPLATDETPLAGDPQLNFRQNTYVIRLADTYLMEAEALDATGARAQALLDAVRFRVGLPSIPVTMDAIMAERRLELAGEGHRWFDLVRTGKAAAKLASRGFVAGKSEIFPIPFKELENTKLKQNPLYN